MRYSDMMGLEMYDDDGLSGWMDGDMLRNHLMAGLGGAGGILVTSALLSRLPAMSDDATKNSRIKNVLAVAIGVLGGRFIYDKNRDVAMGFVGGVAGLGLAQLLASFAPDTLSTSLSDGALSGADLAALEAAVASNSPSWQAGTVPSLPATASFSGPVVREQTLAATDASAETLGEYYPPPSF